jgi:hypothetical protein
MRDGEAPATRRRANATASGRRLAPPQAGLLVLGLSLQLRPPARGHLSALSVYHSEAVFYGGFLWASNRLTTLSDWFWTVQRGRWTACGGSLTWSDEATIAVGGNVIFMPPCLFCMDNQK